MENPKQDELLPAIALIVLEFVIPLRPTLFPHVLPITSLEGQTGGTCSPTRTDASGQSTWACHGKCEPSPGARVNPCRVVLRLTPPRSQQAQLPTAPPMGGRPGQACTSRGCAASAPTGLTARAAPASGPPRSFRSSPPPHHGLSSAYASHPASRLLLLLPVPGAAVPEDRRGLAAPLRGRRAPPCRVPRCSGYWCWLRSLLAPPSKGTGPVVVRSPGMMSQSLALHGGTPTIIAMMRRATG